VKQIEIDYTTDNPGREYAAAIRAATTRKELIAAIESYARVADDALVTAQKMSENDFADFKRDIPTASRKQSEAWVKNFNDRFGAIALPLKLTISTLIASQYSVPWGTAVIRCEEEKWPMIPKS
jgi:hypothetical protein